MLGKTERNPLVSSPGIVDNRRLNELVVAPCGSAAIRRTIKREIREMKGVAHPDVACAPAGMGRDSLEPA